MVFDSTFRVPIQMIQQQPGIAKNRRLTGNQRKKKRELQAAIMGISADELLKQRRSRMEQWHREKSQLLGSRCPNCGIFGHSYKWCPFSHDFDLQKETVTRFRGPCGSWGTERQLDLSPEESQRFRQYFGLLCMPLDSKS